MTVLSPEYFSNKSVKLFAVILCSFLLIAGCSDKTPQLTKLPSNAVILAFGDSLTYGTGAKDNETYPAYLEKLTGMEVINEGNPGELSAQGLNRLPSALEEHEPDLLILCHGGNDMLRKKSREKLANNLKAMIKLARDRGTQVVLLGVPEPALFLLESDPLYPEVAGSENVPIDSDTLPEILGDDDLKSDTIHPNATGYRILAEAVANLLKKAGAI